MADDAGRHQGERAVHSMAPNESRAFSRDERRERADERHTGRKRRDVSEERRRTRGTFF